MAKPTTNRWTKLTFWLGDGASPEDFTKAVCGMTTKSFSINAALTESLVPDCDNPDDPAWIERVVKSLSAGWKGAGVMAEENFDTYRDWMLSGQSKNAYVVLDISSAKRGYFSGAFVCAVMEIAGNLDDGKINVNYDVQSDGEVIWIDGAVPA